MLKYAGSHGDRGNSSGSGGGKDGKGDGVMAGRGRLMYSYMGV